MVDDGTLLSQTAKQDQTAFKRLFDRYSPYVFRLSYSLVTDRQMAEDITQETFVKLWQMAPSLDKTMPVKSWLLKVARNHAIDVIRKKINDNKKQEGLLAEQLGRDEHYAKNAGETAINAENTKKIIKNAIFSLPERQKEALTYVYYMEVSNTEAADIMGITRTAFDSLLARSRRSLAEILQADKDSLKE